ncbi:MAG: P-type ATPase [Burkholderiales bacterium]
MTLKLHVLAKSVMRLLDEHSSNEALITAARLERESLLKWLDTTEQGLLDREAEDRLVLLSSVKTSDLKAKVLRRDRRSAVPQEIAAVFSVRLLAPPPQRREIPASELVPGDLIELGEGDIVPVNARLLSCDDFHVDQSAYTGIAFPIRKYAGIGEGKHAYDYPNVVLHGMKVARGTALAVVVSNGPIRVKSAAERREAGNFSAYGFLVPQR